MRRYLYVHGVEYELSPIHQGDGAALIPIMADVETRRFYLNCVICSMKSMVFRF